MANKSPAFQFYPKDFLADINVVVMNMEERGVYITLLSHLWLQGSLPNNSKMLQHLCNNPSNWKESWKNIKHCFYSNGNSLFHKRIDEEMKKQKEWKKKCRKGGLKSAENRRVKGVKGSSRVVQLPSVQLKGNSSSSSSSSSSSLSSSLSTNKNIKNTYGQDDLDRLFEKWWKRYPKKVDKSEAKRKWIANIITHGIDPQLLEDALTGYVNVLNRNETALHYVKHAKTFLFPGNKGKKIDSAWQQYIPFADPKHKARPPL